MGKIFHAILGCAALLLSAWPLPAQERCSVRGKVTDGDSGEAVVYALVRIDELSIQTTTDRDGMFSIPEIPKGSYRLSVSFLGFQPASRTIEVRDSLFVAVKIYPMSFQLDDVVVMPVNRPTGGTSSSTLTQAALEYIQPSSLSDVFQLLPGYLSYDANISSREQMYARQAGGDDNTALGASIILGGAPLSNNATLLRLPDELVSARSTVGGGIDLRQISTDHMEEVEVIQGISSVKYGDMSSSVVILQPKSGASPLNVRVKADPLNKLIYAGKGFSLGERAGTLHVGIDLTQGRPDVREQLQKYTRISFQGNYTGKSSLGGTSLNHRLTFSYVGTLDTQKNDPDLTPKTDRYDASFHRFTLSYDGTWDVNRAAVSYVEAVVSASYTSSVLQREMLVAPQGVLPYPSGTQAGEHEGTYLPAEYLSRYRNEDRPLNLFAQFNAVGIYSLGRTTHRAMVGLEASMDKNVGRGMVYDATYPPYPTSSYASRERRYSDVPAMVRTALFAEEKFMTCFGEHKLALTAGIRLSMLGNLPSHYRMQGRVYAEPRVNMIWTLPSARVGGQTLGIALRAGYGQQMKMPTLDYLYPQESYNDVIVLNYYSQTEANRVLWVNTSVSDRTKPELKPNKNVKFETGADFTFGKYTLSLTAFREESTEGFAYRTRYYSFPYVKYSTLREPVEGKPSLEDFLPERDTLLLSYSLPMNSERTVKTGVEYSLTIPEIPALRTSITLNGAYYRTLYDNSLPMQKYPSGLYMGKPYPYVGIYDWDYSTYREQFNTNIWLNTHIPRFRLYFSTMIQVVWTSRSWSKKFSGLPTSYIGKDGIERPFTPDMASDPAFSSIVLTFSDSYFEPNVSPVSVSLNLKASKEIGKNLKASFFVNRLWDYNPRYRTNLNTETRRWVIPFFGAEVQMKL